MWELIRANKRRSILLMGILAGVLLGLGALLGAVFVRDPAGAWVGAAFAALVWAIMVLVSLSAGDQILLAASRAKPVTKDVHPMLFNVVEEMTIAAGLPKMPKIYIIDDPAPNAFATGRSPQSASVAVTAGLLARLNRDELQGVIAHEISHILHRDILYVTLAGIMLGSIVLLSHVFLRGMFYRSLYGSSSRRRTSSQDGGGQAQVLLLIIAIVAAILAPIMAQLLYFALSRRREYLADAGAARLTRYPEGLASALEKIAQDPGPPLAVANKATAPLYIANPFKRKGQRRLADLTSTHPPISERIRVLRQMSGASYRDYAKALESQGHRRPVVPAALLQDDETQPLRPAGDRPAESADPRGQHRRTLDLMRTVNGFIMLSCACGVKLKIPPGFKGAEIRCPRCHRTHAVPRARSSA